MIAVKQNQLRGPQARDRIEALERMKGVFIVEPRQDIVKRAVRRGIDDIDMRPGFTAVSQQPFGVPAELGANLHHPVWCDGFDDRLYEARPKTMHGPLPLQIGEIVDRVVIAVG
jgi:hypothetical protein